MLRRIALAGALLLAASGCAQFPSALPNDTHQPREAPLEVVPAPAASVTSPADEPAQPVATSPATPPAPAAPPPPADIWDRVRGGFQMTSLDGPLVHEWEQWYATRPGYVRRMVERSGRFLYHVIEEIDRRRMPAEIALLPMIESAYNPQAYSRSHASGMWQFIPSTGRTYGLRQNFWYDGRRDPIAATSAALDYLQNLYDMFGNWELALAAYNWGEGAVSRAIAKNQARGLPTDYESLTLPPETRNYLPKLQAVKNIVMNPQAFGLELASIPNRPYFTSIATGRHIDVKLAARFAGMSLEEFRFLNPAHNKPVIKAHGDERILLPLDRADSFLHNLEMHNEPLVSWQAYTVKRSDRPERIAATHGMSLARLKEVNGIPGGKRIVAGQTLLVPITGNVEPNLPDLPAPRLVKVRSAGKIAQAGRSRRAVNSRRAVAKGARKTIAGKSVARAARTHARRGNAASRPARKVVVAESGKNQPR